MPFLLLFGVCILVFVMLQALLSLLGVPFGAATALSLGGLFVVVPLTWLLLVRIYGNDFAEASTESPPTSMRQG